jgi:D-3-phosphoglycerate dehydrogenase
MGAACRHAAGAGLSAGCRYGTADPETLSDLKSREEKGQGVLKVRQGKIFICDCDHIDVDIEKNIFQKAGLDFEWLHCRTEQSLIENCQGAVAFMNQYAPITEHVLQNIPSLKLVVRYGVGVDNIDVAAATRHGVQVCNIPDYGTNEVADHALALMLALVRKIPYINSLTHSGVWDYQKSIPVLRNAESTVGIIGVGRIGSAFAKRVRALGCRVIGYDSNRENPNRSFPDFVEFVSLDELMKQSDVISIHCSLETSRNLIDYEQLKKMKKTAFLINVARGGIIKEADLVRALSEKRIAGAGIDVVANERLEKDDPLFQFDNVIVTPHMAWYSEQSARELNRKVAEEVVRFMEGEPVHYPINHPEKALETI